jgi:hypothetical protein
MITRRAFVMTGGVLGSSALIGVTGSGGALATAASNVLAGARGASTRRLASQPVVAFFDGQLWLDTSGASVAYRPPTAARAVAAFTDEELYQARGYI